VVDLAGVTVVHPDRNVRRVLDVSGVSVRD
jgi:hypothetical protein